MIVLALKGFKTDVDMLFMWRSLQLLLSELPRLMEKACFFF